MTESQSFGKPAVRKPGVSAPHATPEAPVTPSAPLVAQPVVNLASEPVPELVTQDTPQPVAPAAVEARHIQKPPTAQFASQVPNQNPAPAVEVVQEQTYISSVEPEPSYYIPESERHRDSNYDDDDTFIGTTRKKNAIPTIGWQKYVRKFGVNVSKSQKEQRIDALHDDLNKPVEKAKLIAVVHPNGGAGATTLGLCVAGTINSLRKAESSSTIIDTTYLGDLSDRITDKRLIHSTESVALDPHLHVRDHVTSISLNNLSYSLHSIGASQKPDAKLLQSQEYVNLIGNLKRHYRFTFVDTDTIDDSELFNTIINSADALLMVVNPTSASSKRALLFRQWLMSREHTRKLWDHTVVAYNSQSPIDAGADTTTFINRVNQHEDIVVGVPWDEHLAEGGVIDRELLHPATQHQFLKIGSKLITTLPVD